MARSFASASSQYLEVDTGIITAAPFTMSCWAYALDLTGYHIGVSIGDKDVDNTFWDLVLAGAIDDKLRLRLTVQEGNSYAISGTYSANTWHHCCGIEVASNSRKSYLDGGTEGTNTASGTMTTPDRISIGRHSKSGAQDYMDGYVAEVGIWDAVLDLTGEISALAAGYSPLFVRPQNLVFYAPLIRDEDRDIVGGLSLTAGGAPTIAPHPRIIRPAPPFISFPVSAAPPTVKPWWYYQRNAMRRSC